MAYDVFISHSSKDKPTADAVCALLEADGIRCWIAPRDILPGIDWGEAIVNAIEGCRLMVLIFSANANTSMQIKREVERAVHKGKAVIPFRIEDVMPSKSLEYFISTSHWLDAFTTPLESHITRLCQTVQCLLNESTPSMTPIPADHIASADELISKEKKRIMPVRRRVLLGAGLMAASIICLAGFGVYRHFKDDVEVFRPKTDEFSRQGEALPTGQTEASWSRMLDEARRLRYLGKISESLAVYSRYRDQFKDTYPSTTRYVETVQAFTLQSVALGVSGGVYIYEIVSGGLADRAGLVVGDVIFGYGGLKVNSSKSYVDSWGKIVMGADVRVDYLRMDETGHFQKKTLTIPHGVLGIRIMDF